MPRRGFARDASWPPRWDRPVLVLATPASGSNRTTRINLRKQSVTIKILQKLGEGGCGVVYMAEQTAL
jgi:hypothetical protein